MLNGHSYDRGIRCTFIHFLSTEFSIGRNPGSFVPPRHLRSSSMVRTRPCRESYSGHILTYPKKMPHQYRWDNASRHLADPCGSRIYVHNAISRLPEQMISINNDCDLLVAGVRDIHLPGPGERNKCKHKNDNDSDQEQSFHGYLLLSHIVMKIIYLQAKSRGVSTQSRSVLFSAKY